VRRRGKLTEQLAPTASQKGWIRIDFNQAVWIPCLPVFPKGHDLKSWSALYAEHWWEASGLEHGKRQVDALRRSLEYLHEFAYSQLPCHMAVIHLPSPGMVPLLVGFGVWEAEGDRVTQLRRLAHADEPDAMEPPIVEECFTEKLGRGLKSLCYLRQPESVVSGALNYAWRSEPLETAVRMFTSCPDLSRLQRAMPDIEALTQVISFVQR
jgi:hypothetical protein